MDSIELNSECDTFEDMVNIVKSPFPVRELTIYTHTFTNNLMDFIEVLAPNLEVLSICRSISQRLVSLNLSIEMS